MLARDGILIRVALYFLPRLERVFYVTNTHLHPAKMRKV